MALNRIAAWKEERPVFLGLPEYGYGDSPPVDWLTSWVDLECVNAYDLVRSLYKLSDAYECPIEYLDTLAWLVGYSDGYWDTSWSEQVKREMIHHSKWLFDNTGTIEAVEKVLQIHGIPYKLWTSRSILLPFTLPATLGVSELRYFIQLPITILRDGNTWKEVERTTRNFNPAVVIAKIQYEGFILGFSRLGDSFLR